MYTRVCTHIESGALFFSHRLAVAVSAPSYLYSTDHFQLVCAPATRLTFAIRRAVWEGGGGGKAAVQTCASTSCTGGALALVNFFELKGALAAIACKLTLHESSRKHGHVQSTVSSATSKHMFL